MEERKAIVQLKNITKSFGDNQVLKPISLDIYEGEFLRLWQDDHTSYHCRF